MKTCKNIIRKFKALKAPRATVEGTERFGISTRKAFGIPIPTLREIASDALRELTHEKIQKRMN